MSTTDDFKKIVKDVRSKTFKQVYFLHGEESYFIDRVAEEIEKNALEEHERDFNLTVLYGRDCSPDDVKDTCLRYPMMAERQVVILREAQTWRIDAFDKLETYFKAPTPTTVLVILYKHKKADGRKTWLKDLAKKQVVFVSDKLKEDKLPEWIQAYVKFHKRRIGPVEAKLLADHLGSDLGKLTNEAVHRNGRERRHHHRADRAQRGHQQGLQHLRATERDRRPRSRESTDHRTLPGER
jgi:DNA polymerase III subunit delta